MAGFVVANYRITNQDAYKGYLPAVMPTLMAHSAEVLVADYESESVEGAPSNVTIVLKFSSKAAARAWYDSPEYQKIIHLHTDNTEDLMTFVDEFTMP